MTSGTETIEGDEPNSSSGQSLHQASDEAKPFRTTQATPAIPTTIRSTASAFWRGKPAGEAGGAAWGKAAGSAGLEGELWGVGIPAVGELWAAVGEARTAGEGVSGSACSELVA